MTVLDFHSIYSLHPRERFIATHLRKETIDELDSLLAEISPQSPYVLIIGESGIGKTALVVNYLRHRAAKDISFFFKPRIYDIPCFLNHLYSALGERYNLPDQNSASLSTTQLLEILTHRIHDISQKHLTPGSIQCVFIDAINNSTSPHTNDLALEEVLEHLDFPSNFRVVLTTTPGPPLSLLHTLGLETSVITVRSSDSKNIADIREFLQVSIPQFENTELDKLTKKCEGNFQYATQAVDILNKALPDAHQLIDNFPTGLYGLYDFNIKQMMGTIHPLRHRNTWHAIHLITASESLPKSMIAEILDLDISEADIILRPLAKYFDLDNINSPEQRCTWFHSSFPDYLISYVQIDEHAFQELADRLLSYLTQHCNADTILIHGGYSYLGLFEKLCPISTDTLHYVAYEATVTLHKLSQTSNIQFNRSFFRYLLSHHLAEGYRVALKARDPHYILLLGLMNIAVKLYRKKKIHSDDDYDSLLAVLHFIHKDSEPRIVYPRPNATDKPKDLMISAVTDYLSRDSSKQELEAQLGTAMLCLRDDLPSPEDAITACRQYSHLCFPAGGSAPPATAEDILSGHNIPDMANPPIGSSMVPIIENASADFMSPSKAQQISKKGSRDYRIVFSELNNSIWFDERRIRPSETRIKFFRYLASQPPGSTLSYADFAVNVWAHPPLEENQILDRSTRETVKRYIKRCRSIRGISTSLGDYLHFEDGIGFTLTDSATTLCIQKTSPT